MQPFSDSGVRPPVRPPKPPQKKTYVIGGLGCWVMAFVLPPIIIIYIALMIRFARLVMPN